MKLNRPACGGIMYGSARKHWRRFKDTNNTKIWKNQERIQLSARLEEGQAQLPTTFVGCKLQHKATQGFQGIALNDASNNRLYGIVKRLLIKHIWVEADDFLPQILSQGGTWVDHCRCQSKQEYGEEKRSLTFTTPYHWLRILFWGSNQSGFGKRGK